MSEYTEVERSSFVIRLPRHPLAQGPEAATGDATMQVTTEVTTEVGALLRVVQGEMPRRELQELLGLRNAEHFRKAYLVPAIAAGWLEMTSPPNSRMQRYRLTTQGRQRQAELLRQP